VNPVVNIGLNDTSLNVFKESYLPDINKLIAYNVFEHVSPQVTKIERNINLIHYTDN